MPPSINGKGLLILTITPRSPKMCEQLAAKAQVTADYAEAIADFALINSQQWNLESLFGNGDEYDLLSQREFNSIFHRKGWKKFVGMRYVLVNGAFVIREGARLKQLDRGFDVNVHRPE
jgi:hypothetical protein